MGRRKKLLDAAEDLLFQLEENVLPMITLSDDVARTKKEIRKLRKLVEHERDEWNARRILKQQAADRETAAGAGPVKLKWQERHEQFRERTAEIPILQLIMWCQAKDIDWSEDFGPDDLEQMLTECAQTSKGWNLGYGDWTDAGHEFVDLHMAGRDD